METSEQIQSLLEGVLSARDREELADRVTRDAGAAREFDEALRIEALLVAAHRPEPDLGRVAAAIRVRLLLHRMKVLRRWLNAAACFLAVGAATLLLHMLLAGGGVVERGYALVGNTPVRKVHIGDVLSTGPVTGAVVRLADGSRMSLAPGSVAVVQGRSGSVRQVVELRGGKGDFAVEKAARQFAVITKVGRVTVVGTEFSVQLLPEWQRKGDESMNGKAVLAMAVAVTVGSVQVEVNGKAYTLSAGAQQVFAEESDGGHSQPVAPRVKESERHGESAQPAKPRRTGEGEGRGSSSAKTISGEVSEISGNTVTIAQRGDGGSKSMIVTLDSATAVSVETDEMESAHGEGGQSKQRRKVIVGTTADLAIGRKVSVTEANGVVTKILVRAAAARRSGGEGEKKQNASLGEGRRGGEGERNRESGGKQDEKKGGGESER